jgi:3-methyladenine DNA glycosylase/8-oxoguanine DNA glycosylase
VRIEAAPGGVLVEPLDAGTEAVVRHLLGLSFDLAPFLAFASEEPVLAGLIGRLRGLRPPLAPDPFEALVGSITAQQVSLFAAFAIRSRLIARFGERASRPGSAPAPTGRSPAPPVPDAAGGRRRRARRLAVPDRTVLRASRLPPLPATPQEPEGGHAYAFPTRERLAGATEEELVALGFSRRKAEYVLALARAPIDLDALAELPDDEVRRSLVAQRGLGEWTADWFLARHLARPRAWPAGDLGLRKAVAAFYGPVDDIRRFGERFAPFENLTAHYLVAGLHADSQSD